MPNYCTNVVRAPKEVLDDLFDNGKITFEKLIPMPKALNITESTTIDNAIAYAMNKKEPDEFIKLKMMLESTKDDYYGNLWDKYKRKFTIENIKEIEKSYHDTQPYFDTLSKHRFPNCSNVFIPNFLSVSDGIYL